MTTSQKEDSVTVGDNLKSLLKARALELIGKKAEGTKVVGYFPNEYFPEEIALACGAIPMGLCRGGDHDPVHRSTKYITGSINEFCRAQIGYLTAKDDIFYALIDLYVSPIVENTERLVADMVQSFTDIPEFRFEVPREKTERAYTIYLKGLHSLKEGIEELTGNRLSNSKLKEAIGLHNRHRELLKTISLSRKADTPPLSGKEFISLVHLSYVLDIKEMQDILETYVKELGTREGPAKGPRILLTGLELGWGDYQVIDLIEEAGGHVVVEQYSSTLRDYWETVDLGGDMMENLAKRYLIKKVNHVAFIPRNERHDFILKLAKEFRVDGLIWYSPRYGDNANLDFFVFDKMWKKQTDLPIIKIETEYDFPENDNKGDLKTRVETFINAIKG